MMKMNRTLRAERRDADSSMSAVWQVIALALLSAVATITPAFGQSKGPARWIDSRSGHASGPHHVDHRLPRSLPNATVRDVEGVGATSSRNELGRLERASVTQAGSGSAHTAPVSAARISVLGPASHNAPINFSHSQQRGTTVTRSRNHAAPRSSRMH